MAEQKVVLELDRDLTQYFNLIAAQDQAISKGDIMQQIAIRGAIRSLLKHVELEKLNAFMLAFYRNARVAFPDLLAQPEPGEECQHCGCYKDGEACCLC